MVRNKRAMAGRYAGPGWSGRLYSSHAARHAPCRRGKRPIIPQKQTEHPAYLTDRDRHRERNRVKRLGNRFKQHRRIATRHEKRVNAYTSFRALVAIRMWL
jgi:transposase